ncbi:hypothetical protein [Microbacterium sp. G2-8]|uniref:hypothetical protein n=1 Tax=Microbacterium sp. G2-8 TaxID=2842454 RepID=UPI001C8AEB74|nr:hypothetical protein [Microbacterium sp. G2-8]
MSGGARPWPTLLDREQHGWRIQVIAPEDHPTAVYLDRVEYPAPALAEMFGTLVQNYDRRFVRCVLFRNATLEHVASGIHWVQQTAEGAADDLPIWEPYPRPDGTQARRTRAGYRIDELAAFNEITRHLNIDTTRHLVAAGDEKREVSA